MKTILTLLLLLCLGCNNESPKNTVNKPSNTITDTVINKPMQQSQYINVNEVKGWDLETIKQKYKPVTEEEFLLNKVPTIHFRIGLRNVFNEKERKQPIPIKEVTWEKDSLTNCTIWFKKDTIWKPVNTSIWPKSAEF